MFTKKLTDSCAIKIRVRFYIRTYGIIMRRQDTFKNNIQVITKPLCPIGYQNIFYSQAVKFLLSSVMFQSLFPLPCGTQLRCKQVQKWLLTPIGNKTNLVTLTDLIKVSLGRLSHLHTIRKCFVNSAFTDGIYHMYLWRRTCCIF